MISCAACGSHPQGLGEHVSLLLGGEHSRHHVRRIVVPHPMHDETFGGVLISRDYEALCCCGALIVISVGIRVGSDDEEEPLL